jgi:ABC-type Fe3+ transport system permease subunit
VINTRVLIATLFFGFIFATMIVLGGFQFFYWAFFDLSLPALPQDAKEVVLFVIGAMTASFTFVFATVTAIVVAWIQQRATNAGKEAALAMPGQTFNSGQ